MAAAVLLCTSVLCHLLYDISILQCCLLRKRPLLTLLSPCCAGPANAWAEDEDKCAHKEGVSLYCGAHLGGAVMQPACRP